MTTTAIAGYHDTPDARQLPEPAVSLAASASFAYVFERFFHPFVGDLLQRLNQADVAGVLDPVFLSGLAWPFEYPVAPGARITPPDIRIDLSIGGPYANYNWELMFHIPVMVAVHLSNNQRFAEAQRWFHYVFDPTSTDTTAPPDRFWKFLAFRSGLPANGDDPPYSDIQNINTLLTLLSTPDPELTPAQQREKIAVLQGHKAMLKYPFQPHVIARTRPGAYQWYVVMKYLDNLIAWGDSLFLQNTIETLNEATLCYVLAANILGPRPQALPPRGAGKPKTFLDLKQAGMDPMGNALVELEGQFPFNLAFGPETNGNADQSGSLFGIGRALYFCIPNNPKLLTYWDTVADRLFKIRNSENIQGVVQQLPLFDPPLDPGMLVKAVAAGIDISSIVSGLNQPLGPMRSPLLIQKAIEIAGEVRALGSALLGSLEKGDAETLAVMRQDHEVQLQNLVKNVRFLQWKHAEELTQGLLKTRATALERYTYYLGLMGRTPDEKQAPKDLPLDPKQPLSEDNFDATYRILVGHYDTHVDTKPRPQSQIAGDSSPSNQAGASGAGQLYLNANEDAELNRHNPDARENRQRAIQSDSVASGLALIPNPNVNLHFWGIGGSAGLPGGTMISAAGRIASDVFNVNAIDDEGDGVRASKTASYQRRADEWQFQANLAARELMQIGRQIIASLISEQIAHHEYETVQKQIEQAADIEDFLVNRKFTTATFYGWQSNQITGLYYQYYRFACDIARKAEQTMKRELMRPELDGTQFIQFNYWDTGHKGLLSGEALHLDLKRMEMAYHDNNKRELELTRHVSLRQLDPLALFEMKTTGACTITIPEWLYDLDSPGLYMRRIKSVALSVPCVVGPYTSINCTLSLQKSTLRVSPLPGQDYKRNPSGEDNRFVDYFGVAETIVTSSASNDSGMFEPNLKDERFLPFEGAGAISTWTLTLPKDFRTFDYMTISDVILHVRYTARQAGDPLATGAKNTLKAILGDAGQSGQALMFCLRYDFPGEWSAFANSAAASTFVATLRKDYFPYLAQNATVTIVALTLYAGSDQQTIDVAGALAGDINKGPVKLTLPEGSVLTRGDASKHVFLVVRYQLTMQSV